MDYTKLSLTNCINLAYSEFGLENPHTIAIARLVDLVTSGYLTNDEATPMAQIIYDHGANSLIYNDAWDDDFVDEADESGFDPYMGCYTGDC
jgi:hypothetical protein